MRTKKRRLVGSLVVVMAAVFAACIAGGPETSTLFEALQITYPNGAGSSWCGNPVVGTPQNCQDVTISPAVGDNFLLMSIDRSQCTQNVWEPVLTTPIGSGYPIACLAGSGAEPAFAGNTVPVPTCIPSSYTFTARFTPSGPGPSSCVMKAVLMDRTNMTMSSPSIYFSGLAVAPPVGLSITPSTTFDFSQVPLMQVSSPVSFTVKNTGSGSAAITVTRTNAVWFPTTGLGSNFSLAAGSNTTFDVACQPQAAQEANGTISFQATGSGGSASQTLNLACEGINSNIAINPSPASFASALVGTAPEDIIITITAPSGSATLTDISLDAAISELSFVSGQIGSDVGIGSNMPHEVKLRYTAQTARPSGLLGNLVVTAQGGSPRNVAITGEALVGKAAVAPGVIDFGPVCASSTATETFEFYAEEAGSFNLMTYEAPAMPFSVTSTDFNPGILLRGNHANAVQFTASVTPTEVNPALSSTMTFTTNLPGTPDVALEMRAVALPAGVSPTPSRVDFGPNPINATTFAQKIVLTNCGTSPITISALRIVGENASEFAIVSPSNPLQTVDQMKELELLVVMTPDTPGAKVAQVEIVYDGGTTIANLDGAAFGGDSLTDGEKDTYYACNVGAGSGLAPLGLAFLLLRRRRRK